jgi:anti-anti-sigma factor
MKKIQVIPHENYTEIKLSKVLGKHCSSTLKAHIVYLNTKGVKNILFDLEKVEKTDSAGISALLAADRICRDMKGKIVLCNTNGTVRKYLGIAQLHSTFHMCDSSQEGIEYLEKEVSD